MPSLLMAMQATTTPSSPASRRSNHRARWAAIGAAIAVSAGAGGIGLTHATAPADATAFVPITPCRLVDTRPEAGIGGRTTPLGADEIHTVTATGQQGQCTLPADAKGLALNVTAVGATDATFLTVWPTGADRPNASALNPAPGQPPAPNAVNTDLNDGGQFSVFNRFGSVHVIADVVGYYTDHHHDDRYYTQAQVDAKLAEAAGVQGPAAWDVIPSGTTVTGTYSVQSFTTGGTTQLRHAIDLPGIAPQALAPSTVNFRNGAADDDDATCTGTVSAPTAPAGKVCIYMQNLSNSDSISGSVGLLTNRSFEVHYSASTNVPGQSFGFRGTWAYTAP